VNSGAESASAEALLRTAVELDGMYSGASPESCVGELSDGACSEPGTNAGAFALAASASPAARTRGADVTRGDDAAGAFNGDGIAADALPASAERASPRTPLTADAKEVAGEKPDGVPAVAEPSVEEGGALAAVRGVAAGGRGSRGGRGRGEKGGAEGAEGVGRAARSSAAGSSPRVRPRAAQDTRGVSIDAQEKGVVATDSTSSAQLMPLSSFREDSAGDAILDVRAGGGKDIWVRAR
jgi:hypothetical protein